MVSPRISLEQWRSLLAVVDAGGYAQAAEMLHKSQSAVTYAVQKIESLLGVKVFEVIGRKAHLTPTGEVLYRRAKALLDEAGALESAAGSLAAGWEPELRLAVEIIFPTWLLLQCFARFAEERPQTRIELYETVLSGTEEALLQRKVDLAICSQMPPGFAGRSVDAAAIHRGRTSTSIRCTSSGANSRCRIYASTAIWSSAIPAASAAAAAGSARSRVGP